MRAIVAFAGFAVACTHATRPTPLAEPPPVADLVKTCAFAVSCLKDPPTTTVSTCTNVLQTVLAGQIGASTIYARYVECARTATDCTSVLQCASRGHDPTYCAAHPGNSCDGDLLVYCSTGQVVDWSIDNTDCAALGMHCFEVNGTASCSDGTSCAPIPGPGNCDGNAIVRCDGVTNLTWREDCSRSGIINATCRSNGKSAGCFPSGSACDNDRCDGDILVQCAVGEEQRTDCAGIGRHCVLQPNPAGPVGFCAADVTSCTDACDNAMLIDCVDGVPQAIDCSTIGLSTCATTHDGLPACG